MTVRDVDVARVARGFSYAAVLVLAVAAPTSASAEGADVAGSVSFGVIGLILGVVGALGTMARRNRNDGREEGELKRQVADLAKVVEALAKRDEAAAGERTRLAVMDVRLDALARNVDEIKPAVLTAVGAMLEQRDRIAAERLAEAALRQAERIRGDGG